MLDVLKVRIRYALRVAIAFAPWVLSMYLLYWLDYSEAWTSDTPHRGKIAVTILVAGMGLSFLVQSQFTKRK